MAITIRDLVFGKYYVVEVSFRSSNPIHRSILCSCRGDSGKGVTGTIMNGSYAPCGLEPIRLQDLAFFRVICEIPEMGDVTYPNAYRLPSDAKEVG